MKKLSILFLAALMTNQVFAWNTESKKPVKQKQIRVALLLDTSNSMDGLIDQAKAQLWEVVNELSYAHCHGEQPELYIALYEYGNDNLSSTSGYTRKILGFTQDLDNVSRQLFSLSTNGGSEYCGTVIDKALHQLDWGRDADDLKMIFIAGNEPFTQGSVDFRDAVAEAKEKAVVVNTIFCGNYRQGIDTKWQQGAQLAYGDYMAIDHNQRTVHIASPYDDLILKLNLKLNKTYIPYGPMGGAKRAQQEVQDANAASYDKANAVSRTVTKGSHLYKNSNWDLVDAAAEEDFELDELDVNSLPTELKGKSQREINAYIDAKRRERDAIQKEIAQLDQKRRAYIAKNRHASNDGLGKAILEAIRKQGEKKELSWD